MVSFSVASKNYPLIGIFFIAAGTTEGFEGGATRTAPLAKRKPTRQGGPRAGGGSGGSGGGGRGEGVRRGVQLPRDLDPPSFTVAVPFTDKGGGQVAVRLLTEVLCTLERLPKPSGKAASQVYRYTVPGSFVPFPLVSKEVRPRRTATHRYNTQPTVLLLVTFLRFAPHFFCTQQRGPFRMIPPPKF